MQLVVLAGGLSKDGVCPSARKTILCSGKPALKRCALRQTPHNLDSPRVILTFAHQALTGGCLL